MHLLSKRSHRAGFIISALLVSVETKSLDRKGTLRMRKQASCLEPGNGGLENSNTSCAGIWKYVGIYYSFSQQMLLGFSRALALYHAGDMHACVLAKSLSCARLLRPHGPVAHQLLCPWDSPGKSTGVGCHFLLQGIFPTQGWKLSLLYLLHEQVDSLPLILLRLISLPGQPFWHR